MAKWSDKPVGAMDSTASTPWGSVAGKAVDTWNTCPYCNCKNGQNHDKFCRTQLSINTLAGNLLGVAPLRVEGEPMSFDTCPDCGEGTCGCAAPDNSWADEDDDKETYCAAVKDGYFPLFDVLRDALDQAQSGKGEERHGNGLPFMEQPVLTITRAVGLGFPLGQAMKKIQECQRMEPDAAKRELLGAINYLAAAVLFLVGDDE